MFANMSWSLLRQSLVLLTIIVGVYSLQNDNSNVRLKFIEEPDSMFTAADGSRIVFKCSASPSDATIKWLRNGNIIERNQFDWIKVSGNKLIVKLQKSSSVNDSQYDALYQCLAELNGQVILSQPAKLIIAELAAFEPQDNITVNVIAGNTAVIPCNLPRGFPVVISQFQYKNLTISRSHNRYRLVPSGSLQIFNARPQDSGIYRCVAHNPFLTETVIPNHFVNLKVIKQKQAKENHSQLKALHFEVTPKEVTKSVLGQNITIECVANGHPVPKIQWIKRDPNGIERELPINNRAFVEYGNLHITTLEKSDEGDYVCRATNARSGQSIEAVTNLEISEMPQIINMKNDEDNYETFEIDEGNDLDLHCETKGFPKPFITWLHNGYVIDSKQYSKGYAISSDEKTLKIIQTNPKVHNGIYQCFATNTLGSTYSIKLVNVRSVADMFFTLKKNDTSNKKDDSRRKDIQDSFKSRDDHFDIPEPEARDVIGNFNSLGDDDEDSEDMTEQNERPNRERKNRKQRPVNSKMNPPTKPIVTRLNDDSVMIRWSVPNEKNNSSLPILFFKVQYRDLSKSIWNTIDEDIPPHIFTYAVSGLEATSNYRFRIAAVYENNDNLNSPNSNKFSFPKDSSKRPVIAPTIVSGDAISSTQISIAWDLINIGDISIDGFFIHYQSAASAGQYMKVTAQGSKLRQITISHLQPGVMYEFKMQTFNYAGTSDFSNIYSAKTLPEPETSTRKSNSIDPDPIEPKGNDISTPPTENQNRNFYFSKEIRQWLMQSDQMQLLVILIVCIALFLVIMACCLAFIIRTKSSSKKMKKAQGVHNSKTPPTLPGDFYFNNSNGFERRTVSSHHLAQSTASLNRSSYKTPTITPSMADMVNERSLMPEMHPLNGHASMMRLPRHEMVEDQMSTLNRKNSFRKSMSISAHHLAYQHQQQNQPLHMPKTYDYQQDSAGHSGSHPSNSDSDDGSLTNAHQMQQHFMSTMERKRAMQRIQESYIQDNSYTLSRMQNHAVSVTRLNGTLERKRRSRGDLNTIDRSYLRNAMHSQHDIAQNQSNINNSMHHQQYLQTNNAPIVIMQSSC